MLLINRCSVNKTDRILSEKLINTKTTITVLPDGTKDYKNNNNCLIRKYFIPL